MKKLFILLLMIIPLNVLAYSNKIIPGGESIGIEINTNGIMVIGFYKIDGKLNKSNLMIGDYITKVNDIEINSIEDLTKALEIDVKEDKKITYTRYGKEYSTKLHLVYSDGKYKSGLYVKDKIVGIGTLSYVDLSSNIYGALGHEIIEENSNELVEIKSGQIYKSFVTSITPSQVGVAGGKNATIDYYSSFGNIFKNGNFGIYGTFNNTNNLSSDEMEILYNDEVSIGSASIRTVIDGDKVESFDINITKIHEYANSKNIEFEITDQRLIDKTGGVVQGMSGSPIIQNDKIAGVVTHVITESPKNGYGIFITTMLKEGEK